MIKIPYGKQWIGEADIQEVVAVLRGDWLTCGPMVKRFEDAVAAYCGARHAVAVCNGTAALHVACLALDIRAGQTGVTSPLTFLASANCIAYCGGRPDFVDIDPATYCLSPTALEAYIARAGCPAVVIPVDFAGVPADLPAFRRLADRHGFKLIEDAAHSLGSEYRDGDRWLRCGCCAHTDMAILSFHPVKTITTGEGGAILTNDDTFARRLRMFANHGTERVSAHFADWPIDNATGGLGQPVAGGSRVEGTAPWLYQQQLLGYNYRITDLQCALGLSQLSRLGAFADRRRAIVARYNDAFQSLPDLIVPPCPEGTRPVNHLYVLRLRDGALARRRLAGRLAERDVGTQVHYIPVYLQPWYRDAFGYAAGKCPHSEAVYQGILSLPLFPAMTDDDVERTIAGVVAELRETTA